MLRNYAGLAEKNSAEAICRRDIEAHSNLISLSGKSADRKTEETAANQERRKVTSAHQLRLLTSCTRRTA
jgi:hypothetical protein